jgi:hypothetical protein
LGRLEKTSLVSPDTGSLRAFVAILRKSTAEKARVYPESFRLASSVHSDRHRDGLHSGSRSFTTAIPSKKPHPWSQVVQLTSVSSAPPSCSARPMSRTSGRFCTQSLLSWSSAWDLTVLSGVLKARSSCESAVWTSAGSKDMLGVSVPKFQTIQATQFFQPS